MKRVLKTHMKQLWRAAASTPVPHEKGVEKAMNMGGGGGNDCEVSHEMGVERPHRVSTPDTVGLYVSREIGVER
jgi:hypothetical protein